MDPGQRTQRGSNPKKPKFDDPELEESFKNLVEWVGEIEKNVDSFRDVDRARQWLNETVAQIDRDFSPERLWLVVRTWLSKKLDSLNRELNLSIPIKAPPRRLPHTPLMRNKAMFDARRQVHKAAGAFERALQNREKFRHLNDAQFLSLVLFSAACYGGLADHRALWVFCRQLQLGNIRLNYAPHYSLCWLDFSDTDAEESRYNNDWVGRQPRRLRRFYPDGTTLVLLVGYLKRRTRSATNPYRYPTSMMGRIRQGVQDFCGEELDTSLTLRQFCMGAIGVAEAQPGVRLPHHLVEYACGRVESVSLPSPYFRAYLGDSAGSSTQSERDDVPAVGVTVLKSFDRTSNTEIDRDIRLVRGLFAGLKTPTKAKHRETLLANIDGLLEKKSFSTNVRLLVKWLRDLLIGQEREGKRKRRLASATVRRYSDWVVRGWLIQFEGVDLARLTGEAWYERYTELIKEEPEKQRAQVAGRLHDFHAFMHKTQKYEDIPVDLHRNYNGKRMIRARVIPEMHFEALIQRLLNSDIDPHSKACFRWIFTLCYRLGTRIGETMRLLLRDIETSDQPLIMFRANRFGDTKTRAPHQLRLDAFLPENEWAGFQNWLAKRRHPRSEGRDLVFGPPRTTAVTWEPRDLSALFTRLIKDATGLHYSPHDCRHTAACRLFLLAEDEVPPEGSAYSEDKRNALRAAAFTADANCRDRIWHLSSVFNHHSPQVTYLNYIHFADLVLHWKLSRAQRRIDPGAIRAILKSPRAFFASGQNRDGFPVGGVLPGVYEFNKRLFDVLESKPREDWGPLPAESAPEDIRQDLPDRFVIAPWILQEIEKGNKPEDVAIQFGQSVSWVQQIHRSASDLAELRTRTGARRLFSSERLKKNAQPLAPTRLREHNDQKCASELIPQLRSEFGSNPDSIRDMCRHWLTHTTTAGSKLPFHSPEDLKRFLYCFDATTAIANSRWLIRVRPPGNKTIADLTEKWAVYPKVRVRIQAKRISNAKKYPDGIASLHLEKETTEKKEDNDKFAGTSKLLKYVAHLLCILLSVMPDGPE